MNNSFSLCSKRMLLLSLLMAFLWFGQEAYSQIKITGKVIDPQKTALLGVDVVVKGTTIGITTDDNGNYSIDVPSKNSTLVYSFIGYVSQEVQVGDKKVINVTLSEVPQGLNEAVVVGYGSMKKSDLTGSVSSVNSKDVKCLPARSATDALEGKIAGVSITSTSGSPGSLPVVRIRGIGTINGTDPIYIVDGFPQGDISWLNPGEIESFEILKDASAAAIYGSRGANGVILVSTKKGTISDVHNMTVSLDLSYSMQSVAKTYDMMNASEFIDYRNLAYKNGGSSWDIGESKDDILSFLKTNFGNTEGTNWQNEIFKKAPVQNYTLSISNGSKNSAYFTSLSCLNQDGIVRGADFKRISWNNNIVNQLTSFARLTSDMSIVYQERHNVDENNINSGTIYSAMAADPITPVYRTNLKNIPDAISDLFCLNYIDQTNPYSLYCPVLMNNKVNPVAEVDIMHQSVWKDLTFRGNVTADIDLASWLKYKGTFNIELYRANPEYFMPKYYIGAYQNNTDGSVGNSSYNTNYYVLDNVLTFDKKYFLLGDQHTVFMLGNSIEKSMGNSYSAYKYGLVTNDESQRIIDAATLYSSAGGSKYEGSLLSYFGRLFQSWDNKYMLTATLRYDGSSNFSSMHKWAAFPSASIGYVFSEEDFMKSLKSDFFSYGKLRLSWGKVGNQVVEGGAYLNTFSFNNGYYLFGNAANQINQLSGGRSYVGNPDLKWETTAEQDLGLDLNFFDNKLAFIFDYYNKKTFDMLLSIPLPAYLGYPNDAVQNAGTVQNNGLEFSLAYKGKISDFNFNVTGNISTGNNKVVSLGGGLPITGGYYSPNFHDFTKTEVGGSIGRFYGYKTNGIFQSQAEIDNYKNELGNAVVQEDARPGDMRYVDVNKDGKINADDQTYIGNPFPKYTYGLSLNCDYKGFDLMVSFYGVQGNDIMNIMKLDFYSGTAYYNAPKDLMTKAWSETNPSNTQFRISTESANNLRVSDWLVEDGSYFQLKNIQVGYTLPTKVGHLLKMQSCRFWVGAANLFTLTRYSGMSPEIGDASPTSSGIDIAFYPQARQYMMGLNVQF